MQRLFIKFFGILVLSFFFMSCGVPLGDRVDSNNLKVYYEKGVTKKQAITFSKYWQKNHFVGETEQTIQLSKNEDNVVLVKLIENEPFHEQSLSVDEQALLSEVKRMLEREVFKKEVVIQITDNTFRPIEKH